MPEKLTAYLQKLKGNIDRVVLVIFLILLVIILLNYFKEQSASMPPSILDRQTPRNLDPMLPNPQYERVLAFLNTTSDPDKANQYKSLWEYNMFDYKSVRDRDLILKEYDKEYSRAEELFKQGKYAEAKDIIERILLHWPSHIKSRELLKQIQAATQPKPTEKPK
jgi:hypothetical protein